MKNHHDVVSGFKSGKEYRGGNVFASDGVLYSYGHHFPLAIRRPAEFNHKDKTEWYLLNGDKYSVSTSKHQSITYSVFREYPRVSFTALRAAGLHYRTVEVIDWCGDEWEAVYAGDDNFDTFRLTVPVGAEYHEHKDDDGNITQKSYHRIGAVVLRQEDQYYLCAMDEGSDFISLLPCEVYTVGEAYDSLKPEIVKTAIAQGEDVKRQGEWFFIPVNQLMLPKIRKKDYLPKIALPAADASSNQHICTRTYKNGDQYLVKGIVRHISPQNRRRADHRAVKLGDMVHMAVCNTTKGNWSASGRVD